MVQEAQVSQVAPWALAVLGVPEVHLVQGGLVALVGLGCQLGPVHPSGLFGWSAGLLECCLGAPGVGTLHTDPFLLFVLEVPAVLEDLSGPSPLLVQGGPVCHLAQWDPEIQENLECLADQGGREDR